MIASKALRVAAAFWACVFVLAPGLRAQTAEPEWRTWTSSNGATIEAYLKEVLPEGVVIVRRDGQEFTAPLGRFSETDQAYVAEWARKSTPNQEDFRNIDFKSTQVPEKYTIDGVEHVRPESGEPPEAAAVKMVLNFHNVRYGDDLAQRIELRSDDPDLLIPPADLAAALQGLPVGTEAFTPPLPQEGMPRPEADPAIQNAIKKAINLDLPVIIGYRPEIEVDTPESVAVAVAYDRRNLEVVEPFGSRKPIPLDWRDLEESLVHAVIVFPNTPTTSASQTGPAEPSAEFLSRVSAAIREVPAQDASTLVALLNERGLRATLSNVNRGDYANQMGQTRNFAREGGVPQIATALNDGNVAIIPQEYETGNGFALVYGQAEGNFMAVEFFPNRTFNRGSLSSADLAKRWLTREDRAYRLDLIQIPVPSATPAAPPPPPSGPPPGRPPAPPRN